MKHLLSLLATLLYIINISNAQTVKNEIRVIGGKKYIIYNIKAGETWASIAEKSGITERSLIDANKQANGSLKNVATVKVPTEKSTKNLLNENTINDEKAIPLSKKLTDTLLTNNANTNISKIIGSEIRKEDKGSKSIVVYKVGTGDNIYDLAKRYNSKVEDIITQNNLVSNTLVPGKIIKIPTKNSLVESIIHENNKPVSSSIIETKKTAIDSVKVAIKNKIDTKTVTKKSNKNSQTIKTETNKKEEIKKYDWNDPSIEKSIVLEDNAKKTAADLSQEINLDELQSNSRNNKIVYTHSVLAGETIEKIAKKYKISISDIANWNNLNQNKIRVGQELIVLSKNDIKSNIKTNNSKSSGNFRYIEEKGLCFISDKKFIGIAHRNAPIGTLLLLTSTENYKKIYVRVTSILVNSNEDVIIQVDNKTAKELAFNSDLTNVLISYNTIE